MKRTFKILIPILILATALLLSSCAAPDPGSVVGEGRITSSDYDEIGNTSSVEVEVTLTNGSSSKVDVCSYSLSFSDEVGNTLAVVDLEYTGGIFPGESVSFSESLKSAEQSEIPGDVKGVSVLISSVSFSDVAFGEASEARLDTLRKTALAVMIVGTALVFIGGAMLLLSKSSELAALKFVCFAFFAFGVPALITGAVSMLAPGVFWFILGVVTFIFALLLAMSKAYAKNTEHKRKYKLHPIDFIGFLAPVHLLISVVGFCLAFPGFAFMPIGISMLIVGTVLLFFAIDAQSYGRNTSAAVLTVITLLIYAVGLTLIVNGFADNLFLSVGIALGVLFVGSVFLFGKGVNPYINVSVGVLSAVGLTVGLLGNVWLIIGSLGAVMALSGIAYFIVGTFYDEYCYGVDIDIVQVVGPPLGVVGSFAAVLGFAAASSLGGVLAAAIASLVGAVMGGGCYLIAFFYERHLKKKNRFGKIWKFDYKSISKECVGAMKIIGITSAMTFVMSAVVMFIIKFVF